MNPTMGNSKLPDSSKPQASKALSSIKNCSNAPADNAAHLGNRIEHPWKTWRNTIHITKAIIELNPLLNPKTPAFWKRNPIKRQKYILAEIEPYKPVMETL